MDRSAWYAKFDKSITPTVKLVDRIAREVGEKHGQHHEKIQDLLEQAGDEMAKWMHIDDT